MSGSVGPGSAVHQGAEVHAPVAMGKPHGRRSDVSQTAVQGQQALAQSLPPPEVVWTTVGLPEPRLGKAFLRPVPARAARAKDRGSPKHSPGRRSPPPPPPELFPQLQRKTPAGFVTH